MTIQDKHWGSDPTTADYGPTSIIIPVWNEAAYTELCLNRIRDRTVEEVEIVVVNNGSTDHTARTLDRFPDVRVLKNDTNVGYPTACNQGILASSGKNIVLMNNDVVVSTGWLGRLLHGLHSDPKIGLVGPLTNYSRPPQRVGVPYSSLPAMDDFAQSWASMNFGDVQILENGMALAGFCWVMKKRLIEDIGLLDERFGIGNFEDDDYCRRAKEAGWKIAIARECFVHHIGSVTFKHSGIDYGALLEKNYTLYREKWEQRTKSTRT